jgi:hypothetical protein
MSDRPIGGFECGLYYKNGSNWVEVKQAQNVSKPKSWTEIAASSRASPSKRYIPGQDDLSVDFEYLYVRGSDPVYDALNTAAENRTAVELAVADGKIGTSGTVPSGGVAGVTWMRDWFHIFKADESQELDGAVVYAFSCKPASYHVSGAQVERSYHTVPTPT